MFVLLMQLGFKPRQPLSFGSRGVDVLWKSAGFFLRYSLHPFEILRRKGVNQRGRRQASGATGTFISGLTQWPEKNFPGVHFTLDDHDACACLSPGERT